MLVAVSVRKDAEKARAPATELESSVSMTSSGCTSRDAHRDGGDCTMIGTTGSKQAVRATQDMKFLAGDVGSPEVIIPRCYES